MNDEEIKKEMTKRRWHEFYNDFKNRHIELKNSEIRNLMAISKNYLKKRN